MTKRLSKTLAIIVIGIITLVVLLLMNAVSGLFPHFWRVVIATCDVFSGWPILYLVGQQEQHDPLAQNRIILLFIILWVAVVMTLPNYPEIRLIVNLTTLG